MMKTRNSLVFALFVCACIGLPGCASQQVTGAQIITPAMTIVPPRPLPPTPETATQRDVANYIVLLRGWGNGLAIQLNSISKLLEEEQKSNAR